MLSEEQIRTERLELKTVKTEKKYQVRLLGVNPDVVDDYARAIEKGEEFPPLTVFQVDGEYTLVDGFHRYKALEQLGVECVDCEVHTGSSEEAHNYSQFVANRKNGARLSRADLRAVVVRLVTDEQHANTPNTTLAELAGVSHSTVQRVREELGLKPSFVVTSAGVERAAPVAERELQWHEGEPPNGPRQPEHDGFPVLTRKVALRLVERLEELEASLEKLEPLSEWLDESEAHALVGVGERVVHLAERAL